MGNYLLLKIKSGMKFNKNDVKAFYRFDKSKYKIGECAIICLTDSIYKIDEHFYVFPITII